MAAIAVDYFGRVCEVEPYSPAQPRVGVINRIIYVDKPSLGMSVQPCQGAANTALPCEFPKRRPFIRCFEYTHHYLWRWTRRFVHALLVLR